MPLFHYKSSANISYHNNQSNSNNNTRIVESNTKNISAKAVLYSIWFLVRWLSRYLQWINNKCYFLYFPQYKSMTNLSHHSSQSWWPILMEKKKKKKKKKKMSVPPDGCFRWNLVSTGQAASEEMSFKCANDADDGSLLIL